MKHIATKVNVKATRDQLILPQKQLQQLYNIGEEVMKRRRPSMARKPRNPTIRKTGVTTLFSGASGTGKTMAAEVLANELSLDLYSIDLSSLGSKTATIAMPTLISSICCNRLRHFLAW